MKEIDSTHGEVIQVDDEDYTFLMQWQWCIKVSGAGDGTYKYAAREEKIDDKRTSFLMHRVLTSCPQGMVVDHKDGNGLNNQRDNLRVCTQSENMQNQRKNRLNWQGKIPASIYKGLSTHVSRESKWVVSAVKGGQRFHGGSFAIEIIGAKAYNILVEGVFKKFAKLNPIDLPSPQEVAEMPHSNNGTRLLDAQYQIKYWTNKINDEGADLKKLDNKVEFYNRLVTVILEEIELENK